MTKKYLILKEPVSIPDKSKHRLALFGMSNEFEIVMVLGWYIFVWVNNTMLCYDGFSNKGKYSIIERKVNEEGVEGMDEIFKKVNICSPTR